MRSTPKRTLADAMDGADVFFGLSAKGALTRDMVASMAPNPIIFAMANPDPEITPEDAHQVRGDAIMATGRSDYPNQVNNVLGFPYIFRGALDVRARTINEEMKIAAARALAELAQEDVPDEVAAAYHGSRLTFGREYLIPVPFDPRLISRVPVAVARAAMESGVARHHIADLEAYAAQLSARLDPIAGTLQSVFELGPPQAQAHGLCRRRGRPHDPRRQHLRRSRAWQGHPHRPRNRDRSKTSPPPASNCMRTWKILNARLSDRNVDYANYLYARLQRDGMLFRDCQRLANQDRNVFAACMVALGDADALVTGLTRNFSVALDNVRRAIDIREGHRPIGVSMALVRGRTVFIADTSVHELPSAEELADIAQEAAGVARRFGYEPRVAFLSYSTFGYPRGERAEYVRNAVSALDRRKVDFEFDGEMAADVALNRREAMALYPFCRLTGPANVLVMPAAHSASISTKMLQQLGGVTVIGPLLTGLARPVQIASMSAAAPTTSSTSRRLRPMI